MKNLFSFFVIIFLFLSGTVLFAQNGKAIQLAMEDAERLFNQGKLDAAKSKLQDILKEQSDFSAGLRLMGLIEMKLGNMVSSVTYYEKLFALKANLSRGAYFEAAEAYMKQYKYNKALEFYLLYKYSQQKDYKTNEESTQRNYDRVIDFNIADCEYSLENNFTGQLDQPLLLKGNINSSQDEFLPTLTVNGDLLLFTTRRDGNENIMVAGKNKEGDWINWQCHQYAQ
jgi:tetratricopeptide (TPR) repeat protein